jgi:hypothetical protein
MIKMNQANYDFWWSEYLQWAKNHPTEKQEWSNQESLHPSDTGG